MTKFVEHRSFGISGKHFADWSSEINIPSSGVYKSVQFSVQYQPQLNNMALSSNFHPAHESYQTRLDFECKRNCWFLTPAQLANEGWIPKTILDCLSTTSLRPIDQILERISLEGHLVYYNPETLVGYFPEAMFNGQQQGDWNIPFIMRVLFLDNWEQMLDAIKDTVNLEFSSVGECVVCSKLCFDVRSPTTYGYYYDIDSSYKGFFMCNNSTKDNYHVTCHDCFQTLMVDRGLRFTKNPTCPCCRTEPSLWLAFTRHAECDVNEYPLMWLRAFYQQVRAQIFLSDASMWRREYDALRVRYIRRREQKNEALLELEKAKQGEVEARKAEEHWKTQFQMSDYSRSGWKKKYEDTRDQWLQSFEEISDLKRQLTAYKLKEATQGPLVPSILGRRPKKSGKNVRLSIKKKFKTDEPEEEEKIEE